LKSQGGKRKENRLPPIEIKNFGISPFSVHFMDSRKPSIDLSGGTPCLNKNSTHFRELAFTADSTDA
jgi:hypothetical protein